LIATAAFGPWRSGQDDTSDTFGSGLPGTISRVEKLVVGFRRKKDGMRIWKQSTRLSLEISLCREKFSMRIIFAQGLFTPFS
jgi:hypothetical protein